MTRGKSLLLAALFVSACSPAAGPHPGNSTVFQPNEDDGKIVIYAVFDNPDDQSIFGETFRFHVDNGYVGDIDDGEYIETKVTPGRHVIDADEIGWGGGSVNHSTLTINVKPRGIVYIAEHGLPEDDATLIHSGIAQGIEDVAKRKRLCNC